MAQFRKVIKHVIKWEGGHSADPRDTASTLGDSGVLGRGYDNRFPNHPIHTNKGIIWQTWTRYANAVNMPNDERVDRFINMSKKDWENLAYTLFWKPYYLDYVKSNAIAQILFEAHWGGGGFVLVRNLQTKLRELGFKGSNGLPLSIDGAMGNNTVYALNNATKSYETEIELIKYLTTKRIDYLKSTSSWSWAGSGWTNRVKEMMDNALNIARQQRVGIITTLIGVGFAYLAYKGYNRYMDNVMWWGNI